MALDYSQLLLKTIFKKTHLMVAIVAYIGQKVKKRQEGQNNCHSISTVCATAIRTAIPKRRKPERHQCVCLIKEATQTGIR